MSDVATNAELEALRQAAGIPHLPTQLTFEARLAIGGEGPRAYDWSDKPHRIVFDLCREIEKNAALPAVQPHVNETPKSEHWPDGLFHLTGDTLGLRCATAGCGQHVSTRYESDGIGSDYCEPCGRKKAQES